MKPLFLSLTTLIILLSGCKKEWLDKKSDKKLTTPSTIEDFQALLDNYSWNNTGQVRIQEVCEMGTDNYFLTYSIWQGRTDFSKNAYIFKKDIWEGATNVTQWNGAYRRIFFANVVLEGLENIAPSTNQLAAYNNAKGSAYFLRAHTFYWIAQLFAKTYDKSTASNDMGIPLRLSSDLNEKSTRATVQQTYDRIIADIKAAIPLLPVNAQNKARPSELAAYALLARTYLSMEEYDSAWVYADRCLQKYSLLMNFKDISTSPVYPIKAYNDEVLYEDINPTAIFAVSRATVDTVLFSLYHSKDLRRKVFFKPKGAYYSFNGSYAGSASFFGGLAVDEVLLTRAECFARKNDVANAMSDINMLLQSRWENSPFVPLVASNAQEALQFALQERRKELCFRGIRWTDLRRLNKDDAFKVTVKRVLNGETFLLEPKSPLYVYPIPDDIISMTGMPQNPR